MPVYLLKHQPSDFIFKPDKCIVDGERALCLILMNTIATSSLSKSETKITRTTTTRAKRSSCKALVNTGSVNDYAFFDRKIEIPSKGLSSYYSICFYKTPLNENG